jgi:hypothetical protein
MDLSGNDRTSTTSILHNIHSPHCPGYKVRTALRHMPESRCTSCNQPGANYSFDLQHRLHRLLVIIHSFLCPVRPPGHKPRYRPTSYTHSHIPSAVPPRIGTRGENPKGLYMQRSVFSDAISSYWERRETCQRGIQERSMRYQGDRGSGSSKTRARKKHKQSPQGCNKPTITCCDSTPCS